MSHLGRNGFPAMPPPSPWVMGVVLIGGGVTSWWLTHDAMRREEEVSRSGWGRWPSSARRPRGMRAYHLIGNRMGGALMVVGGLAVLGVQLAQA